MAPPLLSLAGVRKAFWRGSHELSVLEDVSLSLAAGDVLAIYGQRRAGKTTLLRIAAGLETPDVGEVRFEGIDLGTLARGALARLHRTRIGWVERTGPRHVELPAADYVALPLLRDHRHREAHRRARAALARVGVGECAGAPWHDLSDAERSLVALAHALAREPALVIADDPTAGLDVIERERVVGLLSAVAEEHRIGVLMAMPDMPATLRSHDIHSLSDGRLIAPAEPSPNGGGTVIDFPARERSA